MCFRRKAAPYTIKYAGWDGRCAHPRQLLTLPKTLRLLGKAAGGQTIAKSTVKLRLCLVTGSVEFTSQLSTPLETVLQKGKHHLNATFLVGVRHRNGQKSPVPSAYEVTFEAYRSLAKQFLERVSNLALLL